MRDALGHAPVGKEVERADGRLHRRRLPLGAADDDAVPLLHLVLLHRLELECRHVDEDVALLDRRRHQLADAAEVHAQLRDALIDRHVERGIGRALDAAGRTQTVAALVAAHRVGELAVEGVGIVRVLAWR